MHLPYALHRSYNGPAFPTARHLILHSLGREMVHKRFTGNVFTCFICSNCDRCVMVKLLVAWQNLVHDDRLTQCNATVEQTPTFFLTHPVHNFITRRQTDITNYDNNKAQVQRYTKRNNPIPVQLPSNLVQQTPQNKRTTHSPNHVSVAQTVFCTDKQQHYFPVFFFDLFLLYQHL